MILNGDLELPLAGCADGNCSAPFAVQTMDGADVAYRDLVERYRAMAESIGFEGHLAWAEAMIEDAE